MRKKSKWTRQYTLEYKRQYSKARHRKNYIKRGRKRDPIKSTPEYRKKYNLDWARKTIQKKRNNGDCIMSGCHTKAIIITYSAGTKIINKRPMLFCFKHWKNSKFKLNGGLENGQNV